MQQGELATIRPRLVAPDALVVVAVALAVAGLFGAFMGQQPSTATLGLATALILAVSLLAPVATVVLLLVGTVLVPLEVLNRHGLGGGVGEPNVLLVDVLLAGGLARVTFASYRSRFLTVPQALAYVILVFAVAQLLHGVVSDHSVGDAGTEARRVAAAAGGFLLAVPVVSDPVRRRWLLLSLLGLALGLGASGLMQWFTGAEFNGSDFGVREGQFGTTTGRGQLQGGLFAYPVAVILCVAALVSGHLSRRSLRALVSIALLTNAACLLFTYERTFWVTTVLGCLLVVLAATPRARSRALLWGSLGILTLTLGLSATAPDSLRAAVERGASISAVESDSSGEHRVAESRTVWQEILRQPITGAGFGATLTWTPPNTAASETTAFVHNGYLWLAWKSGLPLALLFVAAILLTVVRRASSRARTLDGMICTGAQASLLTILAVNVTFSSFNAFSIAAVTGVLIALCWVPPRFERAPDRFAEQEAEVVIKL